MFDAYTEGYATPSFYRCSIRIALSLALDCHKPLIQNDKQHSLFLRNLQSVFDIPRLGSTPTCLSGVYGAQQPQGHEAIAERSKERHKRTANRENNKHIYQNNYLETNWYD